MNRRRLLPLSPRGQQIVSLVLNAVAFGTHADLGDVDSLAEKLGRTPGRLRPTLRKLVDQGYLTVEGQLNELVYPTVAAIQWQNPKLSEREAEAILRRLK